MSGTATEEFRVRIDRKLAKEARRVAEEIGTTPGEVVRLLFAEMVKRRAIPFPLQADSPEAEVLGSAGRRAKLWDFMNEGKTAAR
jgi:addiction module RelB/DinJ family antitoxin